MNDNGEGVVESLSGKITASTNEKFEVDTKIQNKQKERDDIQTECTESEEDYKAETAKR